MGAMFTLTGPTKGNLDWPLPRRIAGERVSRQKFNCTVTIDGSQGAVIQLFRS